MLADDAGKRQVSDIEQGRYSFDGLAPGEYVLACAVRGFRGSERRALLRAGEPEHGEDFALDPMWMLNVHILTPRGEDLRGHLAKEPIAPLIQIAVVVTADPLGERLPAGFLLNRSDYGVGRSTYLPARDGQRDDRIEVLAGPPVHVSALLRDIVLATERLDTTVDEMTLTVGLEEIRGLLSGLVLRVLDGGTGATASDAWVGLQTAQSTEAFVHPDEDGTVRYSDRVPGMYEVCVFAKQRAIVRQTVELRAGEVQDIGTIRLSEGVAIRGRFADEHGNPRTVKAAIAPMEPGDLAFDEKPMVALVDSKGHPMRIDVKHPGPESGPETQPRRPAILYSLDVDAQGRFSSTSLSAGRYVIQVERPASWMSPPVLVDTEGGPIDDLVVVVRPTVVVILRPVSEEVAGLSYRVLTRDGLACAGGSFYGASAERVELSPGSYVLRTTRAGKIVREQPVELSADGQVIDVGP